MDVKKRNREVASLNLISSDDPAARQRHIVIAPTVTRKPVYDAMLNDSQIVSQYLLEELRNKALNRLGFGRDDLRKYKELAETLLRQIRLEMEVEKHVEQRTKTQSDREVAIGIAKKLKARAIAEDVIVTVLEELGLELG